LISSPYSRQKKGKADTVYYEGVFHGKIRKTYSVKLFNEGWSQSIIFAHYGVYNGYNSKETASFYSKSISEILYLSYITPNS